jgi:flagellar basal body-associated protein FliL
MSLIQEALKRQEEEHKKANVDATEKSISDAISDDVKLTLKPKEPITLPDVIAVSTPEESPILNSSVEDDFDDFILPDGFSMDNFSEELSEPTPLLIKDDEPSTRTPVMTKKDIVEEPKSLLSKKEELAFSSTKKTTSSPIAPPKEGGLGSLKLQAKETPKKLYEDPVEENTSKKSKKKKKASSKKKEVKTSESANGLPVHPALNKSKDDDGDNKDKKSNLKIIMIVVLFLLLIGAGVYYALTLIGGGDFSSITKHIPGMDSKKTTVNSSLSTKQGTIKASSVSENPKSTAGKAVLKATQAAEKLTNAQKEETAVTESVTGIKTTGQNKVNSSATTGTSDSSIVSKQSVVVDSNVSVGQPQSTQPVATGAASISPEQKTPVANSGTKSLSEKHQSSRMADRIKAKLEAKRVENERLKSQQEDTTATEELIAWPAVTLSGTIGLSKSGAAIFDKNNIINVGDTYKGMTLVDVTKKKKSGVVLEFQGETRFLTTGQSF